MIIGLLLIIVGIFGIGFYFGNRKKKQKGRYNREDTGNVFMNLHNYSEYIENQYDWYCEMCKIQGKTPMLMEHFKSEIKTNKKLQEQFNDLGIDMYGGK